MSQFRTCLYLVLISIILVNCGDDSVQMVPDNGELLFHSGFEAGTMGFPLDAHGDLTGIDNSVVGMNDWVHDFDSSPILGGFNFQYEGGVPSERFVKLIDDPSGIENRILQFWLQHPNVEEDGVKYKGRVQANIYNNTAGQLKEMFQKVRLYLPEDMAQLEQAPGSIGWLTIFEFWNDPGWIDPSTGFRITVNLKKLDANPGTPLTLGAHGQDFVDGKYQSIWDEDHEAFQVPIEKWMTIEIYFLEGDNENGRFYLSVQPDGESKQVLFDVTNYTHHPDDTNPDGLTHFNPMKLYTGADLINYMQSQDKAMQIYWDDFELWRNKKPE